VSTPPARDPRRQASDAQARRLVAAEGGAELRELLRARATGGDEPAPRPAADVAHEIAERYRGDTPAPIGIWRPADESGDLFVRDDDAATRDWWPPHAHLAPKRSLLPLRVVLLGESTAAGWFYAPGLTPARVLEQQLAAARGAGIFEVLDLTMINLQADALVELTGAVLQLAPDVLVVFAGNNWPQRLPSFPGATLAECADAAHALRADGPAGLRRLADEQTRRSAENALDVIARVAEAGSVALVVVVPEVNLADWPRDRPVPWLAGDAAGRWHAAHAKGLGALDTRAWAQASAAAREMIALDGGVSPTSHRLLGDALKALGRHADARAAYLAAVDARAWDNFPSTPSATSAVREAIRHVADRHGCACVDLPAVLAAEPPGRRLFLDYCHLTGEGMGVAMAAVAAAVLQLAEPARSAPPAPAAPAVASGSDATVKLMTALYTAHWADPPDVGGGPRPGLARQWLAAALEASPSIEGAARAYAAARALPAEAATLSVAHERFHDTLGELERRTTHEQGLDAEMVTAIRDLLAARGTPLAAGVEEGLVRHHGPRPGGIDLARAQYHWRLLDRYDGGGGFAQDACAFYRARWPACHFCLVAGGTHGMRLHLTARLPRIDAERAGEVAMEINGTPVGAMALTHRWTRASFDVPAAHLRRGLNRLTLRWPTLPPEGDAALARILGRLEHGVPTDLHPVFGEIFALLALPAAP
jgi:hypothetical protein